MQSKVKNFRFTEVMCSDLDRLATIWKCTATEAVARALTQAVTVEDWKAYQSAQHENFSLDEEKISPAEQQQPEPDRAEDSTQTVTTIAADAAPRPKKPKAAELPLQMDKPKRLQVRIFITGEKKPCKTFSSYDRSELDRAAKQWLSEHGYQTYTESNGTSFRWNV